jgi:hypothetical protein
MRVFFYPFLFFNLIYEIYIQFKNKFIFQLNLLNFFPYPFLILLIEITLKL